MTFCRYFRLDPRGQGVKFILSHYAGDVSYNVRALCVVCSWSSLHAHVCCWRWKRSLTTGCGTRGSLFLELSASAHRYWFCCDESSVIVTNQSLYECFSVVELYSLLCRSRRLASVAPQILLHVEKEYRSFWPQNWTNCKLKVLISFTNCRFTCVLIAGK